MISNLESPLPASVMSCDRSTGIAIVCAWCNFPNGKKEADAWAAAQGYTVSHGICRACYDQMVKDDNL